MNNQKIVVPELHWVPEIGEYLIKPNQSIEEQTKYATEKFTAFIMAKYEPQKGGTLIIQKTLSKDEAKVSFTAYVSKVDGTEIELWDASKFSDFGDSYIYTI